MVSANGITVRPCELEADCRLSRDSRLECSSSSVFPGTHAAEALLQAAGIVIDCRLPLGPALAEQVSRLTGESIEIEDYADAAHVIRRWFATVDEDASRH